ncbi:TPA: hypothetical protein ACGOUU_000092 [Streptococcus suis]
MKKTFVTLATVAALVAAAAPVLATESVFDETLFNTTVPVESPEYPANTVQTNPSIENQKVEETTPAPTYAEENNTPGNPGEEQYVTVETPVDVDGDGKTDRIDVKRVSTGVWVNKGEEVAPTEETATTETSASTATASTSTTTASANTGKTAAKAVAAAKTTTGAKTLPKTSAAK